ncbi:hypothetical protein LINPERPRIM_LOCUS6216 [Linum perenne]
MATDSDASLQKQCRSPSDEEFEKSSKQHKHHHRHHRHYRGKKHDDEPKQNGAEQARPPIVDSNMVDNDMEEGEILDKGGFGSGSADGTELGKGMDDSTNMGENLNDKDNGFLADSRVGNKHNKHARNCKRGDQGTCVPDPLTLVNGRLSYPYENEDLGFNPESQSPSESKLKRKAKHDLNDGGKGKSSDANKHYSESGGDKHKDNA